MYCLIENVRVSKENLLINVWEDVQVRYILKEVPHLFSENINMFLSNFSKRNYIAIDKKLKYDTILSKK